MKRLLVLLGLLVILGFGVFYLLTMPKRLPAATMAGLTGDPARGEQVFWAGGCANCHAALDATGEARLQLGGGQAFPSAFGTFYAPNISTDPANGIGGWSVDDLANAMMRGIGPAGQHFYPAFPYASFTHAKPQDVADLHAFLGSLPAVDQPSRPHDVGFPFNISRGIGLWNLLYLTDTWVVPDPLSPEAERGRYLAEALGHCGECHTPRDATGGMQRDRWLAGGPMPDGKGAFPNITPAKLKWSTTDIAYYLKTGMTPEYDSAGGHMALVVESLAHLPDSDLEAIAAYLKAVPPVE